MHSELNIIINERDKNAKVKVENERTWWDPRTMTHCNMSWSNALPSMIGSRRTQFVRFLACKAEMVKFSADPSFVFVDDGSRSTMQKSRSEIARSVCWGWSVRSALVRYLWVCVDKMRFVDVDEGVDVVVLAGDAFDVEAGGNAGPGFGFRLNANFGFATFVALRVSMDFSRLFNC